MAEDEGFDGRFAFGANRKEQSASSCRLARLHRSLALDGFESRKTSENKEETPKGVSSLLAEDEGFEPPQTESESGVLPLHKSSMWPFRLPRHKQHGYYSTETKNVKHYFPFSATFFSVYRVPASERKYVPKRRKNEKKLLKKGKQNGTMEM